MPTPRPHFPQASPPPLVIPNAPGLIGGVRDLLLPMPAPRPHFFPHCFSSTACHPERPRPYRRCEGSALLFAATRTTLRRRVPNLLRLHPRQPLPQPLHRRDQR